MLDTGSTVSIIGKATLDRVNNKLRRQNKNRIDIEKVYCKNIKGIGPTPVTPLGKISLWLELGPITIPIQLTVVEHSPQDVLFGLPSLCTWGLIPDPHTQTLAFHSHPGIVMNMKCIHNPSKAPPVSAKALLKGTVMTLDTT